MGFFACRTETLLICGSTSSDRKQAADNARNLRDHFISTEMNTRTIKYPIEIGFDDIRRSAIDKIAYGKGIMVEIDMQNRSV